MAESPPAGTSPLFVPEQGTSDTPLEYRPSCWAARFLSVSLAIGRAPEKLFSTADSLLTLKSRTSFVRQDRTLEEMLACSLEETFAGGNVHWNKCSLEEKFIGGNVHWKKSSFEKFFSRVDGVVSARTRCTCTGRTS
jgi:hypothetical protein